MTEDQPSPVRPKLVEFKPKAVQEEENKVSCQDGFRKDVTEVLAKSNFETGVFVSLNEDGSYSIRHVGSSRLEAVGLLQMAAQMIILRGMG